jgi:hypothetical protein
LKAFGNANHILSVSEYTRDNFESRVQLVANSPVLIDASVKKDIETLFASSKTSSSVFKNILQGLITDQNEWSYSTKEFVERNEANISAALAFLRHGRPADTSYGMSQARATIRHSLSDLRKKKKKGSLQ